MNVKIKKAYCPPKIVQGNPCLEYVKYMIFPWFGEFKVERKADNGGDRYSQVPKQLHASSSFPIFSISHFSSTLDIHVLLSSTFI